MKKFFLFFFMSVFLLLSPAYAEEVTSTQALKSFSAWSIVHYKDYNGNWEQMWDGWLNDPDVPIDIKTKGLEDREEIQQNMQDLKESMASLRDQAVKKGGEAWENTKSWLEDLKNSTQQEIDETLNKAIKGE